MSHLDCSTQGKIAIAVGVSCCNDLAVRLHSNRKGIISTTGEIGGYQTIAAEGNIQRAVGVIARQGEITTDINCLPR